MSVLSEDKVLRINCPGFGVSSILPLGEAKPLAMYEVIVVNPTSVLHLFENNSDVIKQIEVLQSDGMTSYRAETDAQLEAVSAEFELRSQELNQFLNKGGLLIFFLAPPFTVSGPNMSIDNYSWLQSWSPDKPSAPNQRNMSASIRGKAIEVSADAQQSVWVSYLKQPGLEWSTIIRNDNLTEGFVPLAAAGPNKCIAGFKSSGPKAGQVVFLPAPYQPDYDVKLKECIERWYALHSDEAAASAGLQSLSKGLSDLLGEDNDAEEQETAAPVTSEPVKSETPAALFNETPAALFNETPAPVFDEAAPVKNEAVKAESNGGNKEAAKPQFFDTPETATEAPQPEALIKKMQENLAKADTPQWCTNFSFEELDGLRSQLEEINEGIRKAQSRAQDLEGRIGTIESLKNALLSGEGETLMEAVTKVLETVGWTVKPALGSPEELWLVDGDKTQAIVRLVHSSEQPNRAELANLAESVITYWGAHEIEPKGILVASTWFDKPPSERKEEDFGEAMLEFAKRKNLCLLTTAQLLSVFRDMDLGRLEGKDVRENMLTTNGKVGQYQFNMKGAAAGTATGKRR
jgi:hypothetical protein